MNLFLHGIGAQQLHYYYKLVFYRSRLDQFVKGEVKSTVFLKAQFLMQSYGRHIVYLYTNKHWCVRGQQFLRQLTCDVTT